MAPRRRELEDLQKQLEKMAEELKRQSVVLAPDAKAKKEEEYRGKVQQFQQLNMQYQDELGQLFNQVNDDLRLKMQGVLAEVAKKRGVDLVIEKSLIMYEGPGLDLTDDLIKAYNTATTAGAGK